MDPYVMGAFWDTVKRIVDPREHLKVAVNVAKNPFNPLAQTRALAGLFTGRSGGGAPAPSRLPPPQYMPPGAYAPQGPPQAPPGYPGSAAYPGGAGSPGSGQDAPWSGAPSGMPPGYPPMGPPPGYPPMGPPPGYPPPPQFAGQSMPMGSMPPGYDLSVAYASPPPEYGFDTGWDASYGAVDY